MTKYKISVMKPARKFIEKQPRPQQERLLKAIKKLPHDGDIIPMGGHKETFRLRVGDYRVIFEIRDSIIIDGEEITPLDVLIAGNRGDVYS